MLSRGSSLSGPIQFGNDAAQGRQDVQALVSTVQEEPPLPCLVGPVGSREGCANLRLGLMSLQIYPVRPAFSFSKARHSRRIVTDFPPPR